ncbi:MAG: thioredoxin fold domain-containing protein [Flavobacteriales bacterium]|jgi:thioredoxin-related protein|nr:thioredoxin fold domain-containing protein [Flavobacteriales bacterium]|tara:strand:- start:3174 stop:3731 length:558 start_codon:yes stop_codon:yes gene_type:complete
MKQFFFTLMVFTLPFAVVSCNENEGKKVKKETNLKQIIKSSNAYSSIEWLSLDELDAKMKESPRKVILLFTKKGCPFCKEMKETTLQDSEIIKLINNNYYAVMLDGKSKDTITFKGIDYVNDASIEKDPKSTWRHNLFAELVEPYNGGYYWPSTVLLDTELEKIKSFPGSQKPAQFKRLLMSYTR